MFNLFHTFCKSAREKQRNPGIGLQQVSDFINRQLKEQTFFGHLRGQHIVMMGKNRSDSENIPLVTEIDQHFFAVDTVKKANRAFHYHESMAFKGITFGKNDFTLFMIGKGNRFSKILQNSRVKLVKGWILQQIRNNPFDYSVRRHMPVFLKQPFLFIPFESPPYAELYGFGSHAKLANSFL